LRVMIVGAGMMARPVAYDLVRQDDVEEVCLVDQEKQRLSRIQRWLNSPKVSVVRADASNILQMEPLMVRYAVAISCVPYHANYTLSQAAINAGTHLCDLGGNNATVQQQMTLAETARKAGVSIIPDCGLAPGLVGVLAADGVAKLDRTAAIHIRVGGLPQRPKPPLNYGLLFSAHGLINEYVESCLTLRDGKLRSVQPLSEREEIVFPDPFGTLEAFNTSGGSSTLPHTFKGKVRNLDYKTIRYPGHLAILTVLRELGLFDPLSVDIRGVLVSPRDVVAAVLERNLGVERDDVVLLRVDVTGTKSRRPRTIRYELVDYADKTTGMTAMMRTTGFPAAVIALMLGRKQIRRRGVFTGERVVPADVFIDELRVRGIKVQVTEN
jgi:lysine 6-dehydrogenase